MRRRRAQVSEETAGVGKRSCMLKPTWCFTSTHTDVATLKLSVSTLALTAPNPRALSPLFREHTNAVHIFSLSRPWNTVGFVWTRVWLKMVMQDGESDGAESASGGERSRSYLSTRLQTRAYADPSAGVSAARTCASSYAEDFAPPAVSICTRFEPRRSRYHRSALPFPQAAFSFP
ncbi:hypothetical protein B0H16DRAFT_1001810 [Mycena metata]|uniref:Uncharacterized protein n=1 Tax=Mycena metata TaxID=1033252 RepID=A0AAD7NV56_9AGAR|nr:hypothetical protein B0H16DRAFT_1001810 [Mycena metata]